MFVSKVLAAIAEIVWKRQFRICSNFVCMFLLVQFSEVVHSLQASVTLKDIESAWQKRESLIQSAEFRCEESDFIRAYSVPMLRLGRSKSSDVSHDFAPEKDIAVTRQFTFATSGSMMQYSYDGDFFHPDEGVARKRSYVSVCDGIVSKNFHDDSNSGQDYPLSGFIPKECIHWDYRSRILLPILMFARPLQKTLGGIDITQYSVSVNKGYIDGSMCILIEPKHPKPNHPRIIYWLDAEHEFVVRRQETKFGSRDNPANSTIDIEYQSHAQLGWVPRKWKTLQNGGDLQETVIVNQSNFNTSIDVDRFRFEYPKGTAVVDMRTGERFIASDDNGNRRTVTNAELQRGATYKELLSTRSGEAKSNRSQSNAWWFRGIAIVLLMTFLAVIIGRVRKKK